MTQSLELVPILPLDAVKWHETPAWRRYEIAFMAWQHGLSVRVIEADGTVRA